MHGVTRNWAVELRAASLAAVLACSTPLVAAMYHIRAAAARRAGRRAAARLCAPGTVVAAARQ